MPEAVSTSPSVTPEDIELLEGALLPVGEDVPVQHTFTPGVYVRSTFFRKGLIVLGHEHLAETINILSQGSCSIITGGTAKEMRAPAIFVSPPGERKVAIFLEDSTWSNVHANPTNETNLEKLESIFISKSPAWKKYHLTMSEQNLIERTSPPLTE